MHHVRLVEARCGIGAAPVADVQEARPATAPRAACASNASRRSSDPCDPSDRRACAMPIAIERIEARVRVPGFVEVNAIDARVEQLLDAARVVAQAVVGGVRDHRMHRARRRRPCVTSGFALMPGAIASLLSRVGRNRADDPVAVAQRHEVVRDRAGHDQAVLDRLVTVAVAQRDLVARDGGHEDHAVRHRRAVGHAVGAMRAEHARGVLLVLADRPGVIEQRAQAADADRQVGAQHVLAEVVEEHAADRRLEEGRAAGVPGRVPGVLVLLA